MSTHFNEFEWIAKNEELFPILKPLKPTNVVCVGCGSSRIENLGEIFESEETTNSETTKNETVAPIHSIIGLDIDAKELENAKARYESENAKARYESSKLKTNVVWHELDLCDNRYARRLMNQKRRDTQLKQPGFTINDSTVKEENVLSSTLDATTIGTTNSTKSVDSSIISANNNSIKEVSSMDDTIFCNGAIDLILDKGTLDHILCNEIEEICNYLTNIHSILDSGHYVLVSFRNPTMLKGIIELFPFKLVQEHIFNNQNQTVYSTNNMRRVPRVQGNMLSTISTTISSSTRKGEFRCYVFERLNDVVGGNVFERQWCLNGSDMDNTLEMKIREKMDAFFKGEGALIHSLRDHSLQEDHSLLTETDCGLLSGSDLLSNHGDIISNHSNLSGETFEESMMETIEIDDEDINERSPVVASLYALEDAYRTFIQEELQCEYSFDYFLEDLTASHPSFAKNGKISETAMKEFLSIHQ